MFCAMASDMNASFPHSSFDPFSFISNQKRTSYIQFSESLSCNDFFDPIRRGKVRNPHPEKKRNNGKSQSERILNDPLYTQKIRSQVCETLLKESKSWIVSSFCFRSYYKP
ncbi:hypothetical protein LEP1GSC060_0416 [Leptospira weilii serovar Ranarum str. ICFT]|uniref:Uncharacterized protein n=1 Tax=Leptospira weilii serovar Ranarum str. ICFT TaxID=1218598 RepID=N1WC92_9LEPT|nr:hypothetical protein LEP1GSC060_0416 [Leptospira weilii serovar Ranarum str. ICFT]